MWTVSWISWLATWSKRMAPIYRFLEAESETVLLDNGYKYSSVPAAHAVTWRNQRNNTHFLIKRNIHKKYSSHNGGDGKAIALLVLQLRRMKSYCLWQWDSQAWYSHYWQKQQSHWQAFIPGQRMSAASLWLKMSSFRHCPLIIKQVE